MRQVLFALMLLCAIISAQGATQDTKTSAKVYTTASGKKYHTHKDCQYIKNSTTIKLITIADAQKQGKTLCSRCKAKDSKKKDKKAK